MEFVTDIFSRFNEKWALLSADTGEDYNCMTVSSIAIVAPWPRITA